MAATATAHQALLRGEAGTTATAATATREASLGDVPVLGEEDLHPGNVHGVGGVVLDEEDPTADR